MSFIPDTTTLIPFAIATMILAITPGPDMTLFVSRTLSQGRAAGFASLAGALTGTLIHTTLVAVGISALIVASPMAFLVLKIFGAAYLVFLAWQALAKGSAFSPEKKSGPEISLSRSWAAGLVPADPEPPPAVTNWVPLFVAPFTRVALAVPTESGVVVVTADDDPVIGPISEDALRAEADADRRGAASA